MRILLIIILVIFPVQIFAEGLPKIHGIEIPGLFKTVKSIHGNPNRTIEAKDWFDFIHIYDGFELHAFNDGKLVGIKTGKNGICNGLGDCIGKEFNSGNQNYIETMPYIRDKFSHISKGRSCPYYLKVEDNVIIVMAIMCKPD